MSQLNLCLADDVSYISLDGHIIYTGVDMDEVGDKYEAVSLDLEVLRETVVSKIHSIRWQSDQHPDVRESRCDALRVALANAGVPECDDIVEVDFDGFVLMVGVNVESAEEYTNSPESFEIMSVTHRGADAMSFIDTLGGRDGWDRFAAIVYDKWSGK